MVYQSKDMTFRSVMDVFRGKVNDVVICENVKGGKSNYYTLLVIKEHETVKQLIKLVEQSKCGSDFCIDMFNSQNCFCLVFDYVKERRLSDFYMAERVSLQACEEICISLLIQCMTSKLPYPILHLILEQRQLHLLKDNSVVLGYSIDLEQLDVNCTEAECAMQCAILARELLEKKISKRNISYTLLLKKIPKQSYHSFRELYKDILLSSSTVQKRSLKNRMIDFYSRNQMTIFKVLLVVSLLLATVTVVVLLSKAFFGDIPFLRLFYDSFKQIGTESLVK